jgi:two-component system nitrogen regulation response regulator GlnG
LRQLINQGLFREDLFYRLNVVPLRLPPLRERLEDVPDLVNHFLDLVAAEGSGHKRLSPDAMDRLRRHNWPGNVRELENLVRRLAALYPEEVIDAATIEAELDIPAVEFPPGFEDDDDNIAESIRRHLQKYFNAHGDALPPNGVYERIIQEVERPLIEICLAVTRGNQLRAAELLGLNRNTLRKKIRLLDIEVIRGLK